MGLTLKKSYSLKWGDYLMSEDIFFDGNKM